MVLFSFFPGIMFGSGQSSFERKTLAIKILKQLGFGRNVMQLVIQEQALSLMSNLKELSIKFGDSGIPMKTLFYHSTVNVTWQMIGGHCFRTDDSFLQTFLGMKKKHNHINKLLYYLLYIFPFFGYIAPQLSGYTTAREMGTFFFRNIKVKNLTSCRIRLLVFYVSIK